jgi:glycosyltransferase involved in cell wall biosynthesis
MKVFMLPNPDSIDPYNGIGRVVHAQKKYLPKYGIEFVGQESEAELVVGHTHQFECKQIDVLHLHGVYWTGDPESGKYQRWHGKANRDILASCRRALSITVPSYWVGEFLRRDFRIQPSVIGHGIDLAEWKPETDHKDYVFWAKNRPADVCSPLPVYELAEKLPKVAFISTFAPVGKPILPNITATGVLSPDEMKTALHQAKVYLATTQETWGITTIESMACGVPVLGYRWGGTAELVQHKVTGWLAEPGDVEGLKEGYEYIQSHWSEMSLAALEEAKRHTWDAAMSQYAELYQSTLSKKQAETHKVSIVITNHNYAPYLKDSIESALKQTEPCEVIVVDDGSTDQSLGVINNYQGQIKVIAQKNQGVAAARNNGIAEASGDYIVCLDADDFLDPLYVGSLLPTISVDRGMGVAYTGMSLINGEQRSLNPWPSEFRFETMADPKVPPPSTIHCAAMFRKSMWERVGGFRQVYAPAEDTEFWVRGLAYGFTAKKVVEDALLNYRLHEGSASRVKKYNRIDYWHPWMRDKYFPAGAPTSTVPLVRSYTKPVFAIAFSDLAYGWNLMESLLGQNYRKWDVYYTGHVQDLKFIKRYPFVRSCRLEAIPSKTNALAVLELDGIILQPEALNEILNSLLNGVYQDTININLHEIINSEGVRSMCATCGGQVSNEFLAKLKAINSSSYENQLAEVSEIMLQPTDDGFVRMRFVGENKGAMTFGGAGITPSGLNYRGGNNAFDRFINADRRDVEWLRNSGFFVVQPIPEKPVDVAPPTEVAPEIKEANFAPKVEVTEPKPPEVKVEYKYSKPRGKK